jgi:predicted transcriptional regulator of viral defense system
MSERKATEPQLRFFTTDQLRAGGKSSGQIATLIRNGLFVPIGRGIYVSRAVAKEFATVPHGDHVLRAATDVARNRPACAVSHESAALLHNIDLIGNQVTEVTITTGNGARRGHRHSVHTYSNDMPDSHITRKFGLPVTTAARTVVDLARTLPYAQGVVAADSALHQGLTTAVELWQLAGEIRLRRGGDRASRLVHFADSLAESPLESLARVIFDDAGLPTPELQVPITGADDQFIGRVDFLWRKHKLIVEVDGAAKYEADPGRARQQLWRDKALRRAGYEVLHFVWREVWHEVITESGEVTAAVWAELRARGADPAA